MAALKAAVAASTDVVFEATPQAVALKVAAKRSEAVIIIICKSLLFSVCVAVQQLVVVGTSQGGEGLQDQVRRSVGPEHPLLSVLDVGFCGPLAQYWNFMINANAKKL